MSINLSLMLADVPGLGSNRLGTMISSQAAAYRAVVTAQSQTMYIHIMAC
jgi:hypothetical protein